MQKLVNDVEVTGIADKGKGVAKVDGLVVFIDHAVPGDVVDLKVLKKKASFLETAVVRIKESSSLRVHPFCQHFGVCGGCKWQDMNYPSQLMFKEQQVIETLKRLSGISLPEHSPILGSPLQKYYRNKLDYSFSSRRWLTHAEINTETTSFTNVAGYHIPGRFDKILDIETCYLQPEPTNALRLFVKQIALQNNFTFYDHKNHGGLMLTDWGRY